MKKFIVLALVCALSFSIFAQNGADADSNYKADFILKLINYTEWPAGAGSGPDGSVVIGVVGQSPITAVLKDLAAKKAAEGKKVTVRALSPDDSLSGCQIAFLPSQDKTELAKFLKKVDGNPILTVSDCESFARHGVMVNFVKENNKVKFEVNTMVVSGNGLKISSQLLKLAIII
jgi:hypothetical protein